MDKILEFVFVYPFIMSILWVTFGIHFYLRQERKPLQLEEYPFVSILVPCYNEEETIENTIRYLSDEVAYPNYEIIVVDDGSKDNTWSILQELRNKKKYTKLRIIRVIKNAGKAHALTQAAIASRGEYLFGVDADAFLEHDAIDYMVSHFLGKRNARVGAVTGSPVVRNRSTLLAKIQLIEYASIIGLIKRAQRVYGRINTVSGVCVMFRKRALLEVGWWDQDMITEDISITWKLQEKKWDVRYEPNAICWMLVPETVKGLWKQRVRWAQGGMEVLIRYLYIFLRPKQWMQLPLLIEQVISIVWSFFWYISMGIFFYEWWKYGFLNWEAVTMGGMLVLVCIIQLATSLFITKRYDSTAMRYLFWAGWYPFVFWLINPLTVIVAFPKAIIGKIKGGQATWTSPDRGIGK